MAVAVRHNRGNGKADKNGITGPFLRKASYKMAHSVIVSLHPCGNVFIIEYTLPAAMARKICLYQPVPPLYQLSGHIFHIFQHAGMGCIQ